MTLGDMNIMNDKTTEDGISTVTRMVNKVVGFCPDFTYTWEIGEPFRDDEEDRAVFRATVTFDALVIDGVSVPSAAIVEEHILDPFNMTSPLWHGRVCIALIASAFSMHVKGYTQSPARQMELFA
jgi:hypothetical protein